jgi:hypothetical protein
MSLYIYSNDHMKQKNSFVIVCYSTQYFFRYLISYFYIKCVKRVFFVHEKVFYAETKVEAV